MLDLICNNELDISLKATLYDKLLELVGDVI